MFILPTEVRLQSPLLVLRGNEQFLVKSNGVFVATSPLCVPLGNTIILKLEHLRAYNATGSLYDRVYPHLLRQMENTSLLTSPLTPLIEGSVGNAGAAFAHACRELGYQDYTVLIPRDVPSPRGRLIAALGAAVWESPEAVGPAGYVRMLENYAFRRGRGGRRRIVPISKILRTPIAPYELVVNEVVSAIRLLGIPQIDRFIFGVGSGNTISLLGRSLKRSFPGIHVECSEYSERPFVSRLLRRERPPLGGKWVDPDFVAGTIHGLPPEKLNLDLSIVDSVSHYANPDRWEALHILNDIIGLRAGRPSGQLWAALWNRVTACSDMVLFSVIFDDLSKYENVNALWDAFFVDDHLCFSECPLWRTGPLKSRDLAAA